MNATPASPPPLTNGDDAIAQRLRREHLVFEVDHLPYAIALADFDSVAEAGFKPETTPALPAWRGALDDDQGWVAVLSLHHILDVAFATTGAIIPVEHRVLHFHKGDLRCALHVHRCLGVFPVEATARLALARSPLLRSEQSGCRAVVKWRGKLVVTLDPGVLLSPALEARLRTHLATLGAPKKTSRRGKASGAAELTATRAGGKEAAPEAGATLWNGALAGGTLAQLLQVLCLRKLSGELALESADHTTFLFWSDGQIIHAGNGAAQPPDAILATALNTHHDRFRFRGGAVAGINRTIHAATPNLIRDAARVLGHKTTHLEIAHTA